MLNVTFMVLNICLILICKFTMLLTGSTKIQTWCSDTESYSHFISGGMFCSPKISSKTQLNENIGRAVVMAVQSFSSRPASSMSGSTTDNAELSFPFTASHSAVYTAEKPNFPPVACLVVDNAC